MTGVFYYEYTGFATNICTEKHELQKLAIHILLAILLAIHNSQRSMLNRPALGEWTNYMAPVKED